MLHRYGSSDADVAKGNDMLNREEEKAGWVGKREKACWTGRRKGILYI